MLRSRISKSFVRPLVSSQFELRLFPAVSIITLLHISLHFSTTTTPNFAIFVAFYSCCLSVHFLSYKYIFLSLVAGVITAGAFTGDERRLLNDLPPEIRTLEGGMKRATQR